MKYFEYTYLVLIVMCMVFLVINYESLVPDSRIYLLIFMGLFSFLYAFRRATRLKAERKYREEEEQNNTSERES
jgi:hypothetical protein